MRLQLTERKRSHACLPCWLLALTVLMTATSTARADAVSGTYTGTVSVRGNYYWERSTRVIAPTAAASLATPAGVRVDASYLLDAITSASTATGVKSDIAFTERRNEGQAGVGYEIDFGDRQLDLTLRGRFSKEPDYRSRGVGFSGALSLDQRNTVLHLNGYFIHDDVYKLDREAPKDDPNRLVASKAIHRGDLDALSAGVSWDQVLNASTSLTLGYDAAFLQGFQANPYRNVAFADGGGAPELHPHRRVRHAGFLWLSHFVRSSRTAFRAGYRLYYDSWELLAHAPDLRIHQEIGPHVEVRLRYRLYTQQPSFFYREGGNRRADEYRTADPKMSRFHNQTFGFKLRLALDFLAFTALDALRSAVLDWSFEYVRNDYGGLIAGYGPWGFIAQGGMSWAF